MVQTRAMKAAFSSDNNDTKKPISQEIQAKETVVIDNDQVAGPLLLTEECQDFVVNDLQSSKIEHIARKASNEDYDDEHQIKAQKLFDMLDEVRELVGELYYGPIRLWN